MDKDKKIALERVKILLKEADKAFSKDSERSDRYVKQARRIAMKVRLKLPKSLKRKFCKNCYKYLKHGVNCRVRVRKKMVVVYCFGCKKYMRFGIK